MSRPSPVIAFLVAALGIATYSCLDAVMKVLVLQIGTVTALFWRNVAGIGVSGILYVAMRPPWPGRALLRLHLLRGTLSTVYALAFFWGLARVPIAEAIAISFVAPLLSLYLSARHLGEKITPHAVAASATAFVGVVVILLGQWQAASDRAALLGTLAVLFSAVLYAVNIVLMRKQALQSGPIEVAFWQSVVVVVQMGALAPFLAEWPPLAATPLLALAALLAVGSLLLLAWAYARGEASYLSTSEYSSFLWASLFGWLLFHERVTLATLCGALLIVAGCIMAARRGSAGLIETEAAL